MNWARFILSVTIVPALLSGITYAAPKYVTSPPLAEVIRAKVGDVKKAEEILLPVITWGGDMATIAANGASLSTTGESIFGQSGLKFKLVRMDDFKRQVELFMQGESPYLRGTLGMINMASEVLNRDPRTKPIVVYQMTWSAGGDCLVVKEGIKTVKDLKGKTIALQAYGPHVDYMGTVLKDAGLSVKDVKIVWTKDLTGTNQSPAEAFYGSDVDAAFVIIPDGMMLSSKGKVGTGAEGSVKGARILVSTRTANRIIADVYAVRADYLKANREHVRKFVHGLLVGEQQLGRLFKEKKNRMKEFRKVIGASAKILLDSEQATGDTEALYGDAEFVGFQGNGKFFGDPNWPRNMENLTGAIQSTLVSVGLLSKIVPVEQAKWDYDKLRAGLSGVSKIPSPRFKAGEVARVIEKKRAAGELGEGELFSFEIFFKPNQNTFPAETYADEFDKVAKLASTYGGAVISVEGHSDPMGYLRKKKEKAPELVLKRIKQAAKNLSMSRATEVRDSILNHSKSKGVSLDPSQFTMIGHGITQPKTGICGSDPCPPKTKEDWLSNMRVKFRIIQVEAEESVFNPLE